jgi:hypothetical protein
MERPMRERIRNGAETDGGLENDGMSTMTLKKDINSLISCEISDNLAVLLQL